MTRDHFGAPRQPNACDGIQHRPIGLKAVAAAVLYHGSSMERTVSHELSPPPAAAAPSSDHEP
jgi:hypothetical protein